MPSVPRCLGPHRPPQALVRVRRGFEAGEKLGISSRGHREDRAIEQGLLGGAASGFEDEIGAVLAEAPGGAIDQSALLRLDPQIEGFAFGGSSGGHGDLGRRTIPEYRNDIVTTIGEPHSPASRGKPSPPAPRRGCGIATASWTR